MTATVKPTPERCPYSMLRRITWNGRRLYECERPDRCECRSGEYGSEVQS